MNGNVHEMSQWNHRMINEEYVMMGKRKEAEAASRPNKIHEP
jgi:hypothetical protein